MCAAVVDMAALMVALSPVAAPGDAAAEAEALALPYPAALRHNDCLHVYRALCTLPHLFAPRLQALVHASVNFVAPATRVKAAGDEALAAMVQREAAQLIEIAVQVSAFREMDGPGVIRCRKGVMQLLHGFRRLGSVLRGMLPAGAFVEVATLLMEAVCSRIAGESPATLCGCRRGMPLRSWPAGLGTNARVPHSLLDASVVSPTVLLIWVDAPPPPVRPRR